MLSNPIDSGQSRCNWHRVRIDADLPPGTSLEVAVAASETPDPPAQGGPGTGAWAGLPTGVPHPEDWQVVAAPDTDVLIRQPAGRYLFVRLRLSGPGSATPVVRRVHLDLPRVTSASLLPAMYQAEADSADFTERFMALFDSVLDTLNEAVTRYPMLLDSDGVPAELLPWIGRFLGIVVDPGWSTARRRALLRAGPRLFRRRGTARALAEAITLLTGQSPVIEEPGLSRPWGAVGRARVGGVRLFGRSATRFRLDASPLGQARLRSFGNPDADARQAGAFRVVVALPAQPADAQRQLRRLITSQLPAHVLADLQFARDDGFILGAGLRLGAGTRLSGPPAIVLGQPGARIGHAVIQSARSGTGGGPGRC